MDSRLCQTAFSGARPKESPAHSSADTLIARLRLEIEKLRRTLYGARSERTSICRASGW